MSPAQSSHAPGTRERSVLPRHIGSRIHPPPERLEVFAVPQKQAGGVLLGVGPAAALEVQAIPGARRIGRRQGQRHLLLDSRPTGRRYDGNRPTSRACTPVCLSRGAAVARSPISIPFKALIAPTVLRGRF